MACQAYWLRAARCPASCQVQAYPPGGGVGKFCRFQACLERLGALTCKGQPASGREAGGSQEVVITGSLKKSKACATVADLTKYEREADVCARRYSVLAAHHSKMLSRLSSPPRKLPSSVCASTLRRALLTRAKDELLVMQQERRDHAHGCVAKDHRSTFRNGLI